MSSGWRATSLRDLTTMKQVSHHPHTEWKIAEQVVQILRERIEELEGLEATGASTADTCEELADLNEFLDRLYTMSLEHARKTLH
jgi:hypothetical protein